MLAIKIPTDQFYIDSLKRLLELFPTQQLYAYIFTDDQNPDNLANLYTAKLNNPGITFSCRKTDNHYDKNVVQDLWAMAQFDCLIRPQSAYSMIAQMIGNFKIVFFPKEHFSGLKITF